MKNAVRNRFLLFVTLALALAARPASAHEGHAHAAMGTVAAITAERLDLKTAEGKSETFTLTVDTKLDRVGKAEPWDKVAVGERVVVHYKKEGAKNIAQHVQLGAKVAEPKATGTASPRLKVVEARYVCMINDQVFSREQIPVKVGGKTYYGCCPMCKERLNRDATARTATDPVSGKPIDKATAVIATEPDGTVHYFESKASLARFERGRQR